MFKYQIFQNLYYKYLHINALLAIISTRRDKFMQKQISMEERRDLCDAIVVSAGETNFQQMFIEKNLWGPIKLSSDRIHQIKYVFIYRKKPLCAITHYAIVDKILPCSNKKYTIFISGQAIQLKNEIPLENKPSLAPQNPRYIISSQAHSAKNLEELFNYKSLN